MDVSTDQPIQNILARVRQLRPANIPNVRKITKELSKSYKDCSAREVIALANALVKYPGRAPRAIAYELIYSHEAALESLRLGSVETLGKGLDEWASVDVFSLNISGQAWQRGQVSDIAVSRWARSRDFWWRRIAVVSTVPLNAPAWGGRGDAPRTLSVCALLADDREDMIVKGISWALRILAEHDPSAVRRFIAEHTNALAPRIKREVHNKLNTGVKNPRRP